MRTTACTLLICAALGAGSVLVAFVRPTSLGGGVTTAGDISDLVFRPHPGAQLNLETRFVDESGHSVALARYFKKSPVILVLEYLRCTSLCGVTLRNVVEVLGRTPLEPGRDYQLVAISIDPRDGPADTTAAHAKYADLLGRNGSFNGIHFLTAPPPAVREIADAVGFPYRYDRVLDAYIHPAGFVVANSNGAISRYLEGVAISPRKFVGAIADAEQQRSQGPLARLALLCHVQGAPLGRFTVPVLAAFAAANIAAALAVFAIFLAIHRRRHG